MAGLIQSYHYSLRLISMACILLWSSAVRVHDSQAYRKMDVTRERISRIRYGRLSRRGDMTDASAEILFQSFLLEALLAWAEMSTL